MTVPLKGRGLGTVWDHQNKKGSPKLTPKLDPETLRRTLRMIAGGTEPASLESETLDFKEDRAKPDATSKLIAEAAICFANARGGTIVVGVADGISGPGALVGTSLNPVDVRRRVHELTTPPLLVDSWLDRATGVDLLIVDVPEGIEIHADTRGRASRRIGTTCVAMSPEEQTRLREERRGIDPSARPSGRALRDVSPSALAVARDLLSAIPGDRQTLATLSDLDLLRALGLVADAGKLVRAGEVLLCEPEAAGRAAIVYQYSSTPGGEPSAVERLASPLLTSYRRVLELIRVRNNANPITLPDGQQLQIEDFPELAVREAIANAVIHRDYHPADPVTVEHSPEVLTVTSPGPLVSGITPENILTHPSKPRNPRLAGAVRLLSLAEEVGRGVDRMFREMIRSGREVPRIDAGVDTVRVALVGGAPNTQVARFVAQLSQRERDDTDAMLILFTLCSRRTVKAGTLARVLQKTADEVEVALRRLASDSVALIEPTRASARRIHPDYRLQARPLRELGSALRYQRRTTDEIDRKVMEHVREYRRITNRTVRNLLDVDTERARNVIASLASREILVKISDAQRGPSVEWGPGPRFPAQRRSGRTRPTAPVDGETLFDPDSA